ncbi:hypothetical protein [Streptomyces sp. NPDC057694]|uniref:hypothetical protein n=1 Tax=Streptomyces sp. NPDC057694 TaxID=3346216 RepID=UPI0036A6947A
MGQEFSFGRVFWVSMVTLLLETALALVVAAVYSQTLESPNVGGHYGLGVLALPFLAAAGAVLAAVVSVAIVLPAVRLSGQLGRRFGGREAWWWVPLVVAAILAPPSEAAALSGPVDWQSATSSWSAATVALTVPALIGRSQRRRLLGAVAAWGLLAVLGVAVLGAVALQTNLLQAYRPPTISRTALVGTWSDGRGATLTFTADGRATSSSVRDYELDEDFNVVAKACTGEGTWSYAAGGDPWNQEVNVDLPECEWAPWNVGGTQEQTTLYHYVGDPDSWDLYKLRRV